MQGDRFFLEIQGNKVQINEPWDFSNVDFTIKQDKEYFYRDLAFGGNKAELMFTKARHEDVLLLLIQEAKTYGGNAEVYFYYNDDIRLRLDFGTYESNYYDYFRCQAIKDTVLDILNDNKDVKVDLLSDKDIFEQTAPKLQLRRAYASAMGVNRSSSWKNNTIEKNVILNDSGALFNPIANIVSSNIKNTYTTGVLAVGGVDYSNLHRFKIIDFLDVYKDLKIKININISVKIQTGRVRNLTQYIYVLRSDNSLLSKYPIINFTDINTDFEIKNRVVELGINYIERGYSMCLAWESLGGSFFTLTDNNSELIISGLSYSFGSIIQTNTYQNCINNLISKITPGVTSRFNVDSNFQADNLLFSGNQIRFMEDKPFILTWKDVVEQLKEFGLGYRLEGNTVVFDNIESFYKDELVHHFNNVNNYDDFKITEDDTYNVNIFEYGYKKYQALKENAIEGNAGTINGESQWYIKNKYTDNSLKIDLPISRDKFLLEDTRVQALAYNENTSTNEDSTLYLFNAKTGNTVVEDTAFLRASFDTTKNTQSFSVRESEFSWVKIGVQENTLINFKINNVNREYIVRTVSDNTIICTRLNHTQVLNLDTQFVFFFSANSDYNFNVSNANDSKSIRQNIEEMRRYLSTYNYYTNSPITNREYKEDANFELNGLRETDPIITKDTFTLSPKVVEFKTTDRFDVYKKIEQNINGYCTVYDLKGELIRFYIKELNLRVLECGNAEYEIKGQIKK